MKILQIITLSELGGAQSVVANLSNRLCEENEVIVAAGEGDGKLYGLLDKRIKIERLRNLKRRLSIKHDPLAVVELRRLYKKYQPDIVHLHSSKAGMLGRVAFPRKKVVYTVHGFDSIRIAYRKFLPIERLMQRFCSSIVGVSKYDKENMLSENITRNVNYIYNGIFVPDISESLSFNLPKQYKKTVLCIARLAPPKDSVLYMKVAELLPDYAFVWIGNQEAVVNHPENVYFMGNIQQAGRYNQIADIFVLPSNYEGLPMVIIEAMSLGKPVVASNVGGISEIVRDGVNGYVVENKESLFAEKIKYILDNEDVARTFGANSKDIFGEHLTVEQMTARYMAIYKKILERN